ncbi:cupin domain-containing protein [Maribacter luteus]|uniref:cupin domain-containing protein n=1 Tax=Maribacter luteus TaxID=2594478 RepID=UPI00248F5AD1|nr:cupin domain-containing protein [Maribacter luteus]|tara:strand:- start:254 stop:547 length:294 start_codon:yes stop_codon:yes gene_type:complete
MYEINSQIAEQGFNKFQLQKLVKATHYEVLNISLEKGEVFPEHTSPTHAHLIVLQGEIVFHINGENFRLKEQQYFNFPKEQKHWVEAVVDSKFLVVR